MLCASESHVHSPRIASEAGPRAGITPHARKHHDVDLTTLEAVDRVNLDSVSLAQLAGNVLADLLLKHCRLSFVRCDDANLRAAPFRPALLELEVDKQLAQLPDKPAFTAIGKRWLELLFGGVHEVVEHERSSAWIHVVRLVVGALHDIGPVEQPILVEQATGDLADGRMHSILHAE